MIHAHCESFVRLVALAGALLLCCSGASYAGNCRDKCAAEEKTCEKHPLSKRQLEIACKWGRKACGSRNAGCAANYEGCENVQPQGLLHVMECMTIQIECQDKCPK
jgi:hypothetical protein